MTQRVLWKCDACDTTLESAEAGRQGWLQITVTVYTPLYQSVERHACSLDHFEAALRVSAANIRDEITKLRLNA